VDAATDDAMSRIRPESGREPVRTAAGPTGPAVRVATGTEEYVALRNTFANETIDPTMSPRDPHAERSQAAERLPSGRRGGATLGEVARL
jgi:hypothetical protein